MPPAALAAGLRDALRARAPLPAVGALEEAEGSLDPLLVVAEVSAVLVEPAAASLALLCMGVCVGWRVRLGARAVAAAVAGGRGG